MLGLWCRWVWLLDAQRGEEDFLVGSSRVNKKKKKKDGEERINLFILFVGIEK